MAVGMMCDRLVTRSVAALTAVCVRRWEGLRFLPYTTASPSVFPGPCGHCPRLLLRLGAHLSCNQLGRRHISVAHCYWPARRTASSEGAFAMKDEHGANGGGGGAPGRYAGGPVCKPHLLWLSTCNERSEPCASLKWLCSVRMRSAAYAGSRR